MSQKDQEHFAQMTKSQKMNAVFQNQKLFNNCFFVNYDKSKVYAFTLMNSDIKKFVTEVQKDCQKIQIRREIVRDNGVTKMKNIVLECRLPGSGSMKQLDGKKNNIQNYKQYKNTDIERIYEIGSNLLKQISSNNPQNYIRFIFLDH